MQAISYQPAEAEDIDLFQLLEQWEPTDNTVGPSTRIPFGSAPAQASYTGAMESVPVSKRAAEVLAPVPGTPILNNRPTPSFAFQQYSDQAPDEATDLMYAPGVCLKGRHVTESLLPMACPPACTPWQQQPIYMPPQQSLSSALIAQGSLTSLSASVDAEDSTAAVSSPSLRRTGSRLHKSEAWRLKNRQAQKKFRQRKKEVSKAQEEEVSRLTDGLDLLLQRRQQLQEALAAAQQGSTGCAVKDDLVLSLQMAQVVLKQRDLEGMQVEGIFELWKGMTQKMALYLPEAQRHPSGELARHLQALGGEAMQLLWALADHCPEALSALEAHNLELGQPACLAGSPWGSVLGQLQLAAQQQHAVHAVHDMLSSNLAQLVAERRALIGRLQELPVTGSDILLESGRQLVEQIRVNVHAAYVCKAYYLSHVWMKILRPLQRAQIIVWAYPFGPDMLSLMSLAARAGGTNDSPHQEASGAAADGAIHPAHVKAPVSRSAGRMVLEGKTAEHTGSEPEIRNSMFPDHAEWRAALGQPLSLLRKES